MSNQAADQEEARPSTPRLDFTGRIRSMLDGDDSILSPDVPSVPGIVSMDYQNSIQETINDDGVVPSTSKNDRVPKEQNTNPDRAELVQDSDLLGPFIGLPSSQQAQVLVEYQNNIHRLFSQNKELAAILETVNQDRKHLKITIPGEFRTK